MTIKEIIDNLPVEKQRQLMVAFENNITQYVEYEYGKYVGVNTANIKNLTKEQVAGNWYVGEIKR
jgi:hypothetical protein